MARLQKSFWSVRHPSFSRLLDSVGLERVKRTPFCGISFSFSFLFRKTSYFCQTFMPLDYVRQKTIHNSLRIAVVSSYFLQIWVDAELRTLKCHFAQSLGVSSSQWMLVPKGKKTFRKFFITYLSAFYALHA